MIEGILVGPYCYYLKKAEREKNILTEDGTPLGRVTTFKTPTFNSLEDRSQLVEDYAKSNLLANVTAEGESLSDILHKTNVVYPKTPEFVDSEDTCTSDSDQD